MKLRRIPFHVRPKLEKEIKDLLTKEIIEPVPVNEPTPWVSAVVLRPKKDNPSEVRICIDMREANKAIAREHHITPTLEDILCDINGATIFSKLDLRKGYHQLELDEQSRPITTFSTHIGLFRYRRLSFGITSAAETFQKAISETIIGIQGAINVSDDILIYGKTKQQHDQALEETLKRLHQAGLTLNEGKCTFHKHHLNFLGHIFSQQGISTDPTRTRDIAQLRPPTTVTEVRSFMGMINFCLRFIPNLATTAAPLRELTKQHTKWKWNDEQQNAFDKIKQDLTTSINMQYFDPKKLTEVWTDASPQGLGAILMQKDQEGNYYPLAFASHALNPTETRYSQIEREALAVTWAIRKFHLYLYGARFRVVTDHQPLVPLFNNPRASLSARLERWRLKLQPYEFEVNYMPGKFNPADFISRHPPVTTTRMEAEHMAEEYINYITNNTVPKSMTLNEVKTETIKDRMLQKVIKALKNGNWTNENKNTKFKAYQQIHYELSTNKNGDLLLRGARLVLPETLQNKALDICHAGHLGITKSKALLREKTWFVGIDRMIERKIKNCILCATTQETYNKPPLIPTKLPERPWEVLNIDHKGPLPSGHYLLTIVDQYSRFPIVEVVSSTSAQATIPKLDDIFSTYGIPEVIITDNGPPFNSIEFRTFVEGMNCKHHRITPLWPQANGEVERLHRTLNKSLQIARNAQTNWRKQMNELLRDYRATPHSVTGISPSELLFGRKMNNRLPDIRHEKVSHDENEVRKRDADQKEKGRRNHDLKFTRPTTKLKVGDRVLVRQTQQNKNITPFDIQPSNIIKISGTQITVEREGRQTKRNESFMKPLGDESDNTQEEPNKVCESEQESNILKEPEKPQGEENNTKEKGVNNSKQETGKHEVEENISKETSQNHERLPRYNFRGNRKPPDRLIESI